MKQIEIEVTEKMQRELNDLRRRLGLEELPIIKNQKLGALFG